MRIVYRTATTTSSACLERSILSAYQQLRILLFSTAGEYFSNVVSGCFLTPIRQILHSFGSGIEIGVCFCPCTPANQWQPRSSRLSFRVTVKDPAPRTSTITSNLFVGTGHCSSEGNCESLEGVEGEDVITSDDDDE